MLAGRLRIAVDTKGGREIKRIIDGLVLMLDNAKHSYGEKIKQEVVNYLRLIMDNRHRIKRLMAFS